jgi:uncharacterized protein (TIGR02145 family)
MKHFPAFRINFAKHLLALSAVFFAVACGGASDSPESDASADYSSSGAGNSSSSGSGNLSYSEFADSTGVTKSFESPLAGSTKIVLDSVKDERDGQVYPTLRIGPYVWMAKNLNYSDSAVRSVCYGNDGSNCKIYGRLYAGKNPDLCPAGFRMPEYDDWRYLKMFVGSIAGLYGEEYWKKGCSGCRDLVGFGALPGGSCRMADSLECSGLGESASFLSSHGFFSTDYQAPSGTYLPAKPHDYYSLRCVKALPIVNKISEFPVCDDHTEVRSVYATDSGWVYDCSSFGWEKDTNSVGALSCKSADFPSPVVIDSSVFTCTNGHWKLAVPGEAGVKCSAKNNLQIMRMNSVDYVCRNGFWETATNFERALGLCDSSKEGSVILDSAVYSGYLICKKTRWVIADFYDVAGVCERDSAYKLIKYYSTPYVCDSSQWRKLDSVEIDIGVCKPEIFNKIDTTSAGVSYVCGGYAHWVQAGAYNYYGKCDSTKYDRTYKVNGDTYVCSGSQWRVTTKLDDSLGVCFSKNENSMKTLGGSRYVCKSAGWLSATRSVVLGVCDVSSSWNTGMFNDTAYVCKNGSWTVMTDIEKALGPCTDDSLGIVRMIDTTHYICDARKWRLAANSGEALLGLCTDSLKGKDTVILSPDSMYYKCNVWGSWYMPTITETFGACNNKSSVSTRIFDKREYVCDPSALSSGIGWHLLNAIDSANGYCKKSAEGKTAVYNDEAYVCYVEFGCIAQWKRASLSEFLGTCSSANAGAKGTYDKLTYLCSGGAWVPQLSTITDSRDNEVYKITTIGTQTWMAENLRYKGVDSSWCNAKDNCASRIYSWSAATGLSSAYDKQLAGNNIKTPHRGICPAGFHIPSEREWDTLLVYLSKHEPACNSGKECPLYYLKDETSWSPSYSYSDVFGFSLKPASYRYYFQNTGDPSYYYKYSDMTLYYMWFIDEVDSTQAKYLNITEPTSSVGFKPYISENSLTNKTEGLAVRCLKD